jgi:ATP-dependent DNA helicase PIF1
LHGHSPNVQRLAVHLSEKQIITFHDNENLHQVLNHADTHVTTLIAWFRENAENPAAYNYRYIDFPLYYTWNSSDHKWNLRKTATHAIGRLYIVQPSEGEHYYLQMLLTHVKDATSFDDLKTVEGHVCGSFKESCIRLGLLQDDTEWDACLSEVSCIRMGQQLHLLFVTILIFCQPVAPEILWNKHKAALCEDILYQNRDLYDDINDTIEQEALRQLESYLRLNAKSLKDFPNMPLFLGGSGFLDGPDGLNQLIQEEMSYDVIQLQDSLHQNVSLLNKDQQAIFNVVLSFIDSMQDFFV